MIAGPGNRDRDQAGNPDDSCDFDSLAGLLSDSLEETQQKLVTRHLDHCSRCQGTLEGLAATAQWWQDTQVTLGEFRELSTHVSEVEQANHPANSDNPHWVVGFLDPPKTADSIGAIGDMAVTQIIGQGGMGIVLKVHDTRLQRWLAVKLLSPMLASAGVARQRFLREAQAAAAVVHPNIVPIYAVSTERQLPYLIMPYVAGGNLQQMLDERGALALERTLAIGLQIAEGLAAAHEQGIVHRDIKPANLLLEEGGFRVLLTDFGLARALDDATLTASGMFAGTPQFMSPEQALGQSVDHRSDIYSLGAVLYAMATGKPPVRGASSLEVLRRLGEESAPPIAESNPDYPSWFQELVDRLMVREVDRRIQSAQEVAALLRACLAHARAPHKAELPKLLRSPWSPSVKASMLVLLLGGLVGGMALGRPAITPTRDSANTSPVAVQGRPIPDGPKDGASKTLEEIPTGEPGWEARKWEQLLQQAESELKLLRDELGLRTPSADESTDD